MSALILPRSCKPGTESPKQWAQRWGHAARMTGTPEPGSGVGLMTERELHDLFSDPAAQEALRVVEERVFGAPTTVGVAMRCLQKETDAERNQRKAQELFDVKKKENQSLYLNAEKEAGKV
jgi:hypothetical protein